MANKVLKHYLEFSEYTYPGLYESILKRKLPDDIRELGLLIRKNFIHRTTLAAGNTGTNADQRFGDMTQIPWWRQPEDDILVTAAAMLAELYRRDSRGLVMDRKPADKPILTCRYLSVIVASILKSKGIPARVRSGNAGYFGDGFSNDHWINQCWSKDEDRWVTVDVDGSLSMNAELDPYDMPKTAFDYPAKAWLDIRAGRDNPKRFHNAKPEEGILVVLWSLFYDFHCLMNNEIIYIYGPIAGAGTYEQFNKLSTETLKRFDNLATLMLNPDDNFDQLCHIWEHEKDLRLLIGGLL